MRPLLSTLSLLLVLYCLGSAAQAQPSDSDVAFSAGTAVPVGVFRHSLNTGLSGSVRVRRDLSERLAVVLEGRYSRQKYDSDYVEVITDGRESAGNHGIEFYTVEVGLSPELADIGRFRFYAVGRAGLHVRKLDFYRNLDDLPGGEGESHWSSNVEYRFGFSAGVGAEFPVAPGLILFAEPSYALAFTDPSNQSNVAFHGGVALSLPR